MVNNGPSRACGVCRKQHIKCDLGRPSCGYCIRKGVRCPGIKRGPAEYEFKGETLSVTHSFGRGSKLFKASTRVPDTESIPAHSAPPSKRSASKESQYAPPRDALVQAVPMHQMPVGSAYDPFGAFSVRIDSHTHELLNFWHSYLRRPCCEKGQATLQLVDGAWNVALRCLWAEKDAISFLAAAADFYTASTGSRRMSVLATKWRVQAIANLRVNIHRGHVGQYVSTILRLFAGDLAAADYSAGLQHAKVLASLFDPQSLCSSNLPNAARHAFFWQETHRATATFTRPMIDLEHEAPRNPAFDPDPGLDCAALVDPALLYLFAELRWYLDAMNETLNDLRLSRLDFSIQLLLLGGKLIDYSVVSAERSNHTEDAGAVFRYRQSAAASLAALYWLRLMTRMETSGDSINGPPIMVSSWPQGPQIANRIRDLFDAEADWLTQPVLTTGALPPEVRLQLWVLEVGSIIERTAMRHSIHSHYHQEQQQRLLVAAGLWERPDVYEEILNAFVPLNAASIRSPAWLTPSIRTWGLRE